MTKQQQIKQILEEEADLDKAVEQILALDKSKKTKVESTVIEEKLGYEILSFKDKYSDRIMVRTNIKEYIFPYNKPTIQTIKFNSDGWYLTEYQLLKNTNWVIHEIKRLSDGVRFKIGDTLKIKNSKTIWGKIDKFWVSHDQLRVDSGNLGGVLVHADGMECLELTKTPLFKTEDGVDIYEGDKITIVNTKDFRISNTDIPENHIRGNSRVWDGSDGYLQFSSKQAAEEYIILNKPVLCINDLIKAGIVNGYQDKQLKELVKSKL